MFYFIFMLLVLLLLIFLGMPIAISMGLSSVVTLAGLRGVFEIPWGILSQRLLYGANNFTLLAIPFFILAGRLCNEARVTDRIFEFARCFVGHIRGGLGQVNVVASMIFAGMSGSAVADAGGLGQMELKAMLNEGYDKGFSAAITAASATIGPIIPPSIPVVIYGALAGTSITRLLIAGFIPGVVMGFLMMVLIAVLARYYRCPRHARATPREFWSATKRGVFPLMMPVILIGGILGGVFTPTEAAAVAVLYAIILGFIYGTLSVRSLVQVLKDTMRDTSLILFIVAASGVYSWVIARYQITAGIIDVVTGVIQSPVAFLLVINLFLLAIGCFLDPTPALFILVPILVPIVREYGIDITHFGIVMIFNLMVGLVTPPVGTVLYAVTRIADIPFGALVRAIAPFYVPLLLALVLLTLFPAISLFLPGLLL